MKCESVIISRGHITCFLTEKKEASYTVEAALVMAIILFLMAALLTNAFNIHADIAGDMVLQEAMELWEYRGEETENDIIGKANRKLQTYFWCGGRQLYISENGRRLNGAVGGEQGNSISVKIFEPEKFLRLLRAVGI